MSEMSFEIYFRFLYYDYLNYAAGRREKNVFGKIHRAEEQRELLSLC